MLDEHIHHDLNIERTISLGLLGDDLSISNSLALISLSEPQSHDCGSGSAPTLFPFQLLGTPLSSLSHPCTTECIVLR
jgi:hypothetical protein